MAMAKGVMVIATKERVGKTAVCMALVSACRKKYGVDHVGFIKPVGKQWIEPDGGGGRVHKDAYLAKVHFGLHASPESMSPVLITRGFTKAYIDGQIDSKAEWDKLEAGYRDVSSDTDMVIVEGTGHVGVGSIVGMNNAMVAKRLGVPVLLVGTGGLGSTFDELALSKTVCDNMGVPVLGIVINKVLPEKLEMVRHYMSIALQRLGAPLMGVIPHAAGFDSPSCVDLEGLFGEEMMSGRDFALRRFDKYEMVTTSLHRFMGKLARAGMGRTCFITHSSRVDLIMGLHAHVRGNGTALPECGLILSCSDDVSLPTFLREFLKTSEFPVLRSSFTTAETMRRIASFSARLQPSDPTAVDALINHIEPCIDLSAISKFMDKNSFKY